MIEHGDLRRHRGGMIVRQVHGAGAELHSLHAVGERGEEHGARGDVLGAVGNVLASEALDEPELIGKHEGFPVLAQGLAPVLVERVDGHGEKAEPHRSS